MRRLFKMILIGLLTQVCGLETMAGVPETLSVNSYQESVDVAPNAIRVPLGLIMLVHKGEDYCAVKFTRFWTGKRATDQYVAYETYEQTDKTGSFRGQHVKVRKGELSFLEPRGIGRLSFSFGKKDVPCRFVELQWTGKGWLYFYNSHQKQGDYGVEIAPTPWQDIPHVDIHDSRLIWYRFNEQRPRKNIPLDQLWQAGSEEGRGP